MPGPVSLSRAEARRLALAAQGFGPRPTTPVGIRHLRSLAARLHALQIDSVNVLVRAHYVPAFARLGPYPRQLLDELTYHRRELFEYWGHAACLLPVALYPVLRYRMQAERARELMRSEQGAYLARVYAAVAERGPLTAAQLPDPGRRGGPWWNWGAGKSAVEHLYNAGLVAIAGRRGFERLYDLAERVIPAAAREAPVPPQEEAMKQLICLAAQAYGVGTLTDVCNYLDVDGWRDRRLLVHSGRARTRRKRLVAELIEEGRLLPARVEGWSEPAVVHPAARLPRNMDARALVTPFDSLVWERPRIERLFGMRYTIEMYTPAPRRTYGYYVCPFLLGDTLVARCDLKADRARQALLVQSAFLEPGQNARTLAPALLDELRSLQAWLALERIEVAAVGDLAPALRA